MKSLQTIMAVLEVIGLTGSIGATTLHSHRRPTSGTRLAIQNTDK
ncbi:MAG TPA: hypothetical protein VH481_11035 [Nitrososphaeraceae archaeon]